MSVGPRLLAAAVAAAVLAGSPASAGTPDDTPLYENDFSSKALYREVRQVGGGNACHATYLPDEDLMRVEVRGDAHCLYRPPVMQEGDLPDQRWTLSGQISDEMAQGNRGRAFLSSRVRAGLGGWYQLGIHPKSQVWIHKRRAPGEGAQRFDSGRLNAIHPIGAYNRLFMKAKDDTFRAEVNDAGTDFLFEDPDPVAGRGVRFGIGSTVNQSEPVIGYFKLLRLAGPD